MTQEDLEQIRVIVSAAISANNAVLFAAMRAIEEHVDLRFDELDKRLELVERRLDRLDSRFSVFEFQMAGIGKSLTIGEKFDGELHVPRRTARRFSRHPHNEAAQGGTSTEYILLDWRVAGLRATSCFRAYVLTIHRSELAIIGHLSEQDWRHVKACVRAAFAI